MFPLSDSIKSGKIPFLTIALIAANLAVFYYQTVYADTLAFINEYALTPSSVSLANPGTLLNFITSMFLHGGLFHLLSNMWFLWIFGDNVEASLGKIKYLGLYLLSGIAGALTQYLLLPDSSIPMLGASAAVSGVLASYVIMHPLAGIRTFVVFLFAISIVSIPAFFYIFYWFFIQVLLGIVSLPYSFATGGIAFWAHVGGFVAGFILTKAIFNKPTTKNGTQIIEGEIIS